jgi:hypothetical protein
MTEPRDRGQEPERDLPPGMRQQLGHSIIWIDEPTNISVTD